MVRINARWRLAVSDLEAIVDDSVCAIVVPKVRSGYQLQAISEVLDELELERSLDVGQTGLVALVETPDALVHLEAIASASPRLQGMILGE